LYDTKAANDELTFVTKETAGLVISLAWVVWILWWTITAFTTKRSAWRDTAGSQFGYRWPLALAWILAFGPPWLPSFLFTHLWESTAATRSAGAALVVAGLAFSIWARQHLGRNWSGIVTIKSDHNLIRTGPYRYVRHPIYTGLVVALIGTALSQADWRGPIMIVAAVYSFVVKIRVEERVMSETFPEYTEYRRQTAALFPPFY
jgi:protein-S-isoprenylcysteine O-methyltransferase Ste14